MDETEDKQTQIKKARKSERMKEIPGDSLEDKSALESLQFALDFVLAGANVPLPLFLYEGYCKPMPMFKGPNMIGDWLKDMAKERKWPEEKRTHDEMWEAAAQDPQGRKQLLAMFKALNRSYDDFATNVANDSDTAEIDLQEAERKIENDEAPVDEVESAYNCVENIHGWADAVIDDVVASQVKAFARVVGKWKETHLVPA